MPPAFWRACRRQGTLLVGTNRSLCFESLQDVRWDTLVIRDTYRNLWHEQKWGIKYHEDLWKVANAYKVGPADRRVTHCDEFVRQEGSWQYTREEDHNGEAAVMRNGSVVLMAANFAWLCGARELLLVGVDYHGPHARMISPYDRATVGWAGTYDRAVPEAIDIQFATAAAAVSVADGRMINLSEDSALRSVPQETWHEGWNCLRQSTVV